MTNRETDGDIHGERAAEIHRLVGELRTQFENFERAWQMRGDGIDHLQSQLDACRPYLKEGETVADALERLSEEAKWQPIRTAPRDGSVFAGWVGAERWSGKDGECSSSVHDVSQLDLCWWRGDDSLAGGFFDNLVGQIGDAQGVTHWMPLPAAPTTKETT